KQGPKRFEQNLPFGRRAQCHLQRPPARVLWDPPSPRPAPEPLNYSFHEAAMNNPIVDKFVEVEREIASEKGDFVLFALLEREERPGRWDVVAAAPWLGEDKRPALDYIIRKIDSKLSREE